MYFVYILRNTKTNKHYIGVTSCLARRFDEHNRGQTKSTRRQGNWMLIYKQEISTKKEAFVREKLIKSYKGGNAFKKLISRV